MYSLWLTFVKKRGHKTHSRLEHIMKVFEAFAQFVGLFDFYDWLWVPSDWTHRFILRVFFFCKWFVFIFLLFENCTHDDDDYDDDEEHLKYGSRTLDWDRRIHWIHFDPDSSWTAYQLVLNQFSPMWIAYRNSTHLYGVSVKWTKWKSVK